MNTKHYTKECRLQAARLVVEQGYTYAEVAQRLGPSAWSIRYWVDKYRKSGDLPSTGQTQATADELQQLRKENSRLRMENDILKKAAAYFAATSGNVTDEVIMEYIRLQEPGEPLDGGFNFRVSEGP